MIISTFSCCTHNNIKKVDKRYAMKHHVYLIYWKWCGCWTNMASWCEQIMTGWWGNACCVEKKRIGDFNSLLGRTPPSPHYYSSTIVVRFRLVNCGWEIHLSYFSGGLKCLAASFCSFQERISSLYSGWPRKQAESTKERREKCNVIKTVFFFAIRRYCCH